MGFHRRLIAVLIGAVVAGPASGGGGGGFAPVVLYTDCPTGPTTGGVGGNGGYLSIFGRYFDLAGLVGGTTKVYIGGAEVAAYSFSTTTPLGTHPLLGIQQITVQVGHAAGGAVGTPMAVSVVTSAGASNSSDQRGRALTFTPSGGRVGFVSQSGDNTTFVWDDINHPARNLQTANNSNVETYYLGGIGGGGHPMQGGDQAVIRGGTWNDAGFNNAWLTFRFPPNGAADKFIHLTGFPGETVHYVTQTGTPTNTVGGSHFRGAFQGPAGGDAGTTGDYIAISNMEIDLQPDSSGDAGVVNMQSAVHEWWCVNVKGSFPSTASDGSNGYHAKSALFVGHAAGGRVLGCHAHDWYCVGASENHCIAYIDSPLKNSPPSNIEVGWCWGENVQGGNMVQFFDNSGTESQGGSWVGYTGCSVHDCIMDTYSKYGVNLATGAIDVQVYNNLILNGNLAAVRIDFYGGAMINQVFNNTMYNCVKVSSNGGNDDGVILVTRTDTATGNGMKVRCNNIVAGPGTVAGAKPFKSSGGSTPWLTFLNNLIYGPSQSPVWSGSSLADAQLVVGDPHFSDPNGSAGGNFSLLSNSAAIDQAVASLPIALPYDITGATRPQGAANDIGAYEYVAP